MLGGKTVDNVESLDILLYDGTKLTVGATSEEELRAIIGEGGRRGEIYSRLAALRDKYADLVGNVSAHSAARLGLQPR